MADKLDFHGTTNKNAVDDAHTFLSFKPSDICSPYPEIGGDGWVGVYWNIIKSDVFAEVIFKGDGTYKYYAVQGTPTNISNDWYSENLSVRESWHEDLVNILCESRSS